jgi:hypothetical protein
MANRNKLATVFFAVCVQGSDRLSFGNPRFGKHSFKRCGVFFGFGRTVQIGLTFVDGFHGLYDFPGENFSMLPEGLFRHHRSIGHENVSNFG